MAEDFKKPFVGEELPVAEEPPEVETKDFMAEKFKGLPLAEPEKPAVFNRYSR